MKTLKILVAVMALLIVIGLGLLGWGMSRVGSKPGSPPNRAVSALPAPPAVAPAGSDGAFSTEIALPPGSRLEQVGTTADRIILRLIGPDGEKLIVVDPADGHVAGTVTLTPAR